MDSQLLVHTPEVLLGNRKRSTSSGCGKCVPVHAQTEDIVSLHFTLRCFCRQASETRLSTNAPSPNRSSSTCGIHFKQTCGVLFHPSCVLHAHKSFAALSTKRLPCRKYNMTIVEDGEILEVDDDGVVDLCSDAEPSPIPISPSKAKTSRSRIRRNIAAFRANVYRGGDPFLYALNSQVDDYGASTDKPHLLPISKPYEQPHDVRNSLNEPQPPSHPYLAKEEAFMQRNPYASDNPSNPALQNGAREPSHAHPLPFPRRIPPRGEMNSSPLPTHAPSGDRMWPYSAPPDGPRVQLDAHPETHPGTQRCYDPDRYSPGADQSRFTQGPMYHAEPGPPPSSQYSMHHQAMMPGDPNFRGLSFEMAEEQRLHSMNQVHDPPPSMYNHQSFSGIVRNEQGFFIRDNPRVSHRYESNPETTSGFRGGVEVLQPRHRQHVLKREKSFQQDPYGPSLSFDGHRRPDSEPNINGEVNGIDESERKRVEATPVKSFVSDEDVLRGNSAESRDSPERLGYAWGVSEGGDHDHRRSIPKGEQLRSCPNTLQGDVSDGEISSPPFPSPVISLATAPDETPSPPSLKKKKPAPMDAKKRLSELRMKALMSVKKRPTAQNSNSSIPPISPRCSSSLITAGSAEALEELHTARNAQEQYVNAENNDYVVQDGNVNCSNSSDDIKRGARIQSDSVVQVVVSGVRRTMTRLQFTQWQEWPYQNRVVVDYSSDSSDSIDASDPEDNWLESNTAAPSKIHLSSSYSREREIETMKIRMVCLGKCPSMLLGRPKKLKPNTGAIAKETEQKTEDRTKAVKNSSTVTKVSKENTRRELVPSEAKTASRDERTVDTKDTYSPEQTVDAKETRPLEQKCAFREGEARPDAEQVKLITGSSGMLFAVSSPQNRVSSEQQENPGLVPDDKPERTKSEVLPDEKRSSKQTSRKEKSQKESPTLMKSSKPPPPAVAAASEGQIAELKRRIAAIEKSRDQLEQQRHKKRRISLSEGTTGLSGAKGLHGRRPSPRSTNLVVDRRRILQVSKPEHSERPSAEVDNVERAPYQRSSRYYGPKPSSSLQGLPALKKGNATDVNVDVPEEDCDSSDSSAPTTVQGAMEPALEIPQDNAQRRYIDDLKLEIEQKRKELMAERNHAEQLRVAEVAIAEAQAKLNFTRSRVADLQEELRKAGIDVQNAEREYERRVKAADQLREANVGDLTELNQEPDYKGRVHYSLDDSRTSVGDVSNDLAIEDGSNIEKGNGEVVDYVLRPSPFSPSTGDHFTSCLRAFRAYLLRIPHHAKAKDRVAGSILSSTWDVGLDPMKAICPQELRGQCSSKECDFQHLKVFKTPKDRALQVIEVIERFFSAGDRQKEAKAIINTRIAIHEGKDATATISSLISTLCASLKIVPYSCASE